MRYFGAYLSYRPPRDELPLKLCQLFDISVEHLEIRYENAPWESVVTEGRRVFCNFEVFPGGHFPYEIELTLLDDNLTWETPAFDTIAQVCESFGCHALMGHLFEADGHNPFIWTLVKGMGQYYRVSVDHNLLAENKVMLERTPVHEKTFFIETNGVKLHVVQAGTQAGKLVILLHGFPEFWYCWQHQIEPLAQAGYHLWIPDQRGYNLSDKPQDLQAYSIDELAKDVIGLIEAAGREQCILVAHDWGGGVAWWLANKYPERLEKLVILNCPHPTVMRRMVMKEKFYRQALKSWYMYAFQLRRLPELFLMAGNAWLLKAFMRLTSRRGTFPPDVMAKYVEAWQQPGAITTMLNWYRASFGHTKVERPTRKDIPVPTLLIWGAKDAFLHRKTAERSLEICPQGRLEFLENASHWVQHEEPEQVNELLLAFLQEEGGRGV